jgi:long-subunit acyl-CoA synthetase (AMP-forming)
VLDEDGCEVGTHGIGEIAVRSEYLATRYWRQPEMAAAAFRLDPEV